MKERTPLRSISANELYGILLHTRGEEGKPEEHMTTKKAEPKKLATKKEEPKKLTTEKKEEPKKLATKKNRTQKLTAEKKEEPKSLRPLKQSPTNWRLKRKSQRS